MIPILIRITLLFLLASVFTLLLRRQSAALRHAVWVVALAGALLMPALEWQMPKRVLEGPAIFVQTPSLRVTARGDNRLVMPPAFAIAIWAFGTALFLIRAAVAYRLLARTAAEAHEISRLGHVPVRMSGSVRSPGVAGILRNIILVPEDAANWTPSVRRAVIVHEVAHIRRRDGLTLAIAEVARAIYWFHPLVWFAFAEMRKESEKSCDDAAIRLGLRPSSYAGHLLQLARAFPPQPAMSSAWMPMATTSHLETRMKAILDPKPKRSAAAKTTWIAAAVAGAAVLLSLSSFTLRAQELGGIKVAEAAQQDKPNTRPIRVGGNIIAANIIHKVAPIYPEGAKQRRAQGVVTLEVLITKEGVPTNLQAKPSDVDAELVDAAIGAVSQWRYQPALLNGEPVEVITTVDINFTLQP